jgi:L-asparaginase II
MKTLSEIYETTHSMDDLSEKEKAYVIKMTERKPKNEIDQIIHNTELELLEVGHIKSLTLCACEDCSIPTYSDYLCEDHYYWASLIWAQDQVEYETNRK